MRGKGVRLVTADEDFSVPVTATEDPAELGPQDYVVVTLKAHQSPGVVQRMQPLLGPDTAVVTAMNGVPWWYFHGLDGPWRDRIVASVDPGGAQCPGIGPRRAIGCLASPAAEIVQPGLCTPTQAPASRPAQPHGPPP